MKTIGIRMKEIQFQVKIGYSINAETGYVEKSAFQYAADYHVYHANKGDILSLEDTEYCYNIATYGLKTEENYFYTYCYQQEENWSTYRKDYEEDNYRQQDYVFQEESYFRIGIKKKNNTILNQEEEDSLSEKIRFRTEVRDYQPKPYFQTEAKATAKSVVKKRKRGSLVVALLTDSHYVINGTWEDTAYNLKQLQEKVGFDSIFHLGDVTDGMIPLSVTKEYVHQVMSDLQEMRVPVYLCLGNHDSNYFHNNPEKMTIEEQSALYLQSEKPYYYQDFPQNKLRCLFLSSFDYNEKIRYGFSEDLLVWVEKILEQTPKGYSVLVLSHVPPLPEIHYWSDEIRNGEKLIQILERYNHKSRCHVLAYLHGHNHAEQIYTKRGFPIISFGCNKLEYFTDKKPEGSYTYERTRNTVTQDLWDVMIVNKRATKIEFVRFGAGEDRTVINSRGL